MGFVLKSGDFSAKDDVASALAAMGPRAVCEALGIARSKEEAKKWVCPSHGGASLSVTMGRDWTLRVKCFGCDLSGDVFTLIGAARASHNFPDQLREGAAIAGISLRPRGREDYTPRAKTVARPVATPVQVPEEDRDYPPPDEIASFWDACVPLDEADDVVSYLTGERGFTTERLAYIADIGAAKALPPVGAALPRWARYHGKSWGALGFRIALPVYDASGVMRSVRAWRIGQGGGPKRLPPAAFKAAGLMLACPFAVGLLRGMKPVEPVKIWFAEGEPDFLSMVSECSDANADAPLVFGVMNGGWTEAFAEKVPDGAAVQVHTHKDVAGDKYAQLIADSLATRCEVRRF
jgi:hypothetical protein